MMKKILIGSGIIVVLFGVINFNYFSKQIRFFTGQLPEPTPIQNQSNTNSVPHSEPNRIRIPSLSIEAPLQYTNEINEEVFQRALEDGVVHYPGTAEVGQLGNAYFFGHSSDYPFTAGNYKTVFALLPHIKNGAEIVVTDKSGQEFTYVVIDQFVANNTDLGVLDQKGNTEKLLSLQTSYPVGTALKRYIVVARLKE